MILKPINLATLLNEAHVILFDFDGPLCDVFAGLPAHLIARRLESLTSQKFDTDDPLEVLRQSVRLGESTVQAVEKNLIAAEIEAINTSIPTPGGLEAVDACLRAGKMVGIVSNNSSQAVTLFLERFDLLANVYPVEGRAYANPSLMKPNPHPLRQALDKLNVKPNLAVFIGDSLTDIETGRIVNTKMLAYANSESKTIKFEQEGVPTIRNMLDIVKAIQNT